MNIQIVMAGTPSLSFAKQGIDEYIKRANGFASVKLVSIKEDKHYEKKLVQTVSGTDVILCDENGKLMNTQEFSSLIEKKIQESTKTLSFVVGPADGHSASIRDQYGQTLSLSLMTLPHDLATLFLAESVYRGLTVIAGHPYHRP